jgi:Periplasmic binding protein domain
LPVAAFPSVPARGPQQQLFPIWLNSNKGTKTLTGLSPKAFKQSFGSLRRGGTAVFLGLPAGQYLGLYAQTLLGTDYVYPRTTNKILRAFLHAKGVQDADIAEVYTPFGHSDYQNIVNDIKKFAKAGKRL